MKKLAIIFLALLLVLSGCSSQKKPEQEVPALTLDSPREDVTTHNKSIDQETVELVQLNPSGENEIRGTIKTSAGNLDFVLYPDKAPVAVEYFINNVNAGVYKNTAFYKVMENFYLETDANDSPMLKKINNPKGTKEETQEAPVGVESTLDLWHFKGAMFMQENLADQPDSGLTRFGIVQAGLIEDAIYTNMEEIGYPAKVIEQYKAGGGIPGFDGKYTVFGQITSDLSLLDDIAYTRVDENYLPEDVVTITEILIDSSYLENSEKTA